VAHLLDMEMIFNEISYSRAARFFFERKTHAENNDFLFDLELAVIIHRLAGRVCEKNWDNWEFRREARHAGRRKKSLFARVGSGLDTSLKK